MPILDIFKDRAPRPPVVGRIKLGTMGETHPVATDTLVFTAADKGMLVALAEKYGGEIEEYIPQGSTAVEYRLVSGADAIDVWFPFPNAEDNYDMSYEVWSRSGLNRRCDGFSAQVNSVNSETGEVSTTEMACVCKAQGNDECDTVTRLRFFLPESPGLGVWELQTKSKWALFELHDILAFLSSRFEGHMHRVPLRLAYVPRTIRYNDAKAGGKQKTTTKRVPTLNLARPIIEVAERLGLDWDQSDEAYGLDAEKRPAPELEPGTVVPVEPDQTPEEAVRLAEAKAVIDKKGVDAALADVNEAREQTTSQGEMENILKAMSAVTAYTPKQVMNMAQRIAHGLWGYTTTDDVKPEHRDELIDAVEKHLQTLEG